MKIVVERQPGCTGKDTWKAVLEIHGPGYNITLLGGGETAAKARQSLNYKFTDMQRAIVEMLKEE